MIKVYERFDEELVSLWKKLESLENVFVFQTFAWCESCARPYVIVWRGGKGETPVILPTALTERGELHFIGEACGDYGDALYEPGVNKYLAFKEIAAYIRAERRIRSIALQKMRSDSEALSYLGVLMKGSLVFRDHMCSRIDISGPDFLSGQEHFRYEDRHRIREMMNKSEGLKLETFSFSRGDLFPMDRIVDLRDAMIRAKVRTSDFLSADKLAFVERIYSAGYLEVVILRSAVSDEEISFQLTKGSRTLYWVQLYRNAKANTMQMARYCHELAARGWTGVFDFGVGAYEYKMRTFRPITDCTFSLRWGRGPVRTAYAIARMLWRFWRQRGA